MNNITIGGLPRLPVNPLSHVQKPKDTASFGHIMKQAVAGVEQMGQNADTAIVDMLSGKADVAGTMIELQKLDISMKTLVSFRNKAIEAYKEVSRMQF